MKEEGVKKVNMSILETEIDLITSIKNDFAIFENSSDLPVLDYPSRLEMGMMAICLRGTTRMSIDLKEYTFGANDMVIVLADQIVQQHQRSDDFLCCVFAVSIKSPRKRSCLTGSSCRPCCGSKKIPGFR